MRLVVVLAVLILLAGCLATNRVLDVAGDRATRYFHATCATPAYRSAALSMDINGRLAQEDGFVLVCCPGDHRDICESGKEWFQALMRRAAR